MLKTLLKKQMAEIFRNYFYDPKKNKMRSRGATIAYMALYALLMVGLLGGIFALMAVGLCGPLVESGMGWLYYLLMGLIAVFLGTFGSVFSTYSSLYLSKDNDLLLSLPIPVRCVMASRLLGVYLLGLMYAAVVIVPGVIVYWIEAPVTAGTIVGGVLMVLIVSVIVMVLSCLLGWVVARISLKLKNKSFITVILSLLFLAAYYFVYYKAQALITLLVENAAVYGMKIRGSAYLLYLFGSVGAGDWLAMGIVTVTQAALLALTLWGIARSACHGTTGSDCASHRFFPSSDTEGAAMSFIEASRHTAAHISTGTTPTLPLNTSASIRPSAPPLMSSTMPATGSIRMPSPQLSI